eukprot:gene9733-biopygen5509
MSGVGEGAVRQPTGWGSLHEGRCPLGPSVLCHASVTAHSNCISLRSDSYVQCMGRVTNACSCADFVPCPLAQLRARVGWPHIACFPQMWCCECNTRDVPSQVPDLSLLNPGGSGEWRGRGTGVASRYGARMSGLFMLSCCSAPPGRSSSGQIALSVRRGAGVAWAFA